MRFVVVPLSTKSAFVFCQTQHLVPQVLLAGTKAATATAVRSKFAASDSIPTTIPARKTPRLDDRIADRARKLWTSWENSPSKFKQTIVRWANVALEKVPYDEYSLKSIPSKSAVLRKVKEMEKEKASHVSVAELEKMKDNVETIHRIQVQYPSNILTQSQSLEIVTRLATKGTATHWKYFLLSLGLAPLTLPIGLIPVLPNLPGFYLLYRAWCNWKAWEGAKHLSYLVKEDHLEFTPSEALNKAYDGCPKFESISNETDAKETIILDSERIQQVTASVEATSDLPAELVRAVHQIEKKLAASSAK